MGSPRLAFVIASIALGACMWGAYDGNAPPTGTVRPEGGSVTSADGVLEVRFRPGTFATATPILIVPLSPSSGSSGPGPTVGNTYAVSTMAGVTDVPKAVVVVFHRDRAPGMYNFPIAESAVAQNTRTGVVGLPGGTQDDANLVFGVATTLGKFVVGHSIPQAAAQACNGNICGTCMRACCGTAQERTPTSGIKMACECGSMPVDQGSCMAQCVDNGEKGTCP